jgi:murein DD-endopeptidase MepM/ murein hydrolase activator NlpD
MAGLLLLGGAYLAGMQSQTNTVSAQPATYIQQQAQIHAVRQQLDDQVADLTARVGQVNAQMLRLNALGKRLTEMAQLDKGEFNFDSLPAQGGPEQVTDEPTAATSDLHEVLTKLETQLIDRERQLVILETFISARQLTQMALPDGSPVPGAWISSQFGRRVDPITGTSAFHSGIDFAAASGAQVYAVAPGVVSWAGDHSGFGQLVEINHGNGYVTRYAHNSRVLVKVGDKVGKGKLISHVGSTGRSTGPHLHFEVLKNGRAVDPRKFVAG